jgi:hypothetical protein
MINTCEAESFWRIYDQMIAYRKMSDVELEQYIEDKMAEVQAEILANPHTDASLRRAQGFSKRCQEQALPASMDMFIDADALEAFDEGDGADACPFRYGYARRRWLEHYFSADTATRPVPAQ